MKIDPVFAIQMIREAYTNMEAIYFFGSVIEDAFNINSDIDIAVLLPREYTYQIPNMDWNSLQNKIAHFYRRDVDLINLRRAPTVLQSEIIQTGKVILCENEFSQQEFEMLTMSYYCKLNEERKAILNGFLLTGIAIK
jgi:predicted nucleotidyltransferase